MVITKLKKKIVKILFLLKPDMKSFFLSFLEKLVITYASIICMAGNLHICQVISDTFARNTAHFQNLKRAHQVGEHDFFFLNVLNIFTFLH